MRPAATTSWASSRCTMSLCAPDGAPPRLTTSAASTFTHPEAGSFAFNAAASLNDWVPGTACTPP